MVIFKDSTTDLLYHSSSNCSTKFDFLLAYFRDYVVEGIKKIPQTCPNAHDGGFLSDVILSLTCVFCYSCSYLFVVCVFVFLFALIGAW